MSYDEFDIESRVDNADHNRKASKEAALLEPDQDDVNMLPDLVTGEMLPATPENAVKTIVDAQRIIARCRDIKTLAEAVILNESERIGAKTLHTGGRTVTVGTDTEIVWDVQELVAGLLDEGLPQDRVGDLVKTTIEEKVDYRVARQLAAANDRYKAVVDACQTRVPKRPYVSVK